MKNNLVKLTIIFFGLLMANRSGAQVTFASQEYIDNATEHNLMHQMSNTETEDNTGDNAQSALDQTEANAEAINNGLSNLNQYLSLANSAHDLYDALRTLDAGDCAPDFSTNAQSMVPISCPDANCASCYTSATNELNFVRAQLARLWCIYNNTKNFNTSAIAFGDNASGIHAVTGLAWQYARADITAAYEHFKGTYDSKYIGLIGSLQRALMQISSCEDQYGEHDWYQRFGFIYYEFMKERYKRTD